MGSELPIECMICDSSVFDALHSPYRGCVSYLISSLLYTLKLAGLIQDRSQMTLQIDEGPKPSPTSFVPVVSTETEDWHGYIGE